MNVPPSPKQGLSWKRLRPLRAEACLRARHDVRVESWKRLVIVVAVSVIATVPTGYFFGPLRALLALGPLGALALVFVGCCVYEFYHVAKEDDPAVLPLLRTQLTVWSLVFLCAVLGVFSYYEHMQIGYERTQEHTRINQLKDAAANERAERIDIAKAALRLEQLRKGKEQFEQAVKLADTAWEGVERVGKGELAASPNPISVPYALASSMRLWNNALGQALFTARKTLGEQTGIGDIEGHTANFKITVPVQGDGEEVISNDWNRRLWREAYDRRLKAQEFVGSIFDRINSEIAQLTQKVTTAAQQDGR